MTMIIDQEIEATEAQLKALLERKKQFANPMARALQQLELDHIHARRDLIAKMVTEMAVGSKTTQVVFSHEPLIEYVVDYMRTYVSEFKYNETGKVITLPNGSKILTCHHAENIRGSRIDRVLTSLEVTPEELVTLTAALHDKRGEFVRVQF